MDEDYSNYLDWLQQQQGGGLLGSSDTPAPQAAADAPAAQNLPDPNALYAQMKGAGVPSDYTTLAPGVSIDGLNPQAKAMAQYVDKNYPNFVITGGSRTPGQNAAVGGAGDSQHLHNNAIDIKPTGDVTPDQRAQFIRDVAAQGARGIGVYPTGSMHVDTRTGAPVIWGSDYHYGSFANEQKGPVLQAGQAFKQGTLNQANPVVTTQGGNTGSAGTPSGPAPAVGTVQGPNLPGNNPGNVDQAGRIPDPSRPATTDPTTTGPTGSAGQGGQAGKGKGDTNQDMLQKLAKGIMGFGALGAKGPYHFAPPVSGGSPVNRPDVASPDSYKAGARILPKIQLKGILG